MAESHATENEQETQSPPMDLALARAAAAFKDADFFESSILFWSAVLDQCCSRPPPETEDSLAALVSGLDLEQELGLDVQADEPIDLVFPTTNEATTAVDATELSHLVVNAETITPIQTYILTALCYLTRHINVRIDILPSGQDTLTSLGPPQRYYLTLTSQQKKVYHHMLAIIFATVSSIANSARQESLSSTAHSQEQSVASPSSWDQQLRIQQTTVIGNAATVTWQTVLSQKRTPHNLPRFFSYLDSSSCTVAGSSVPRNELDVDALEQAGFRLVITLIKESPLSATWFHRHGHKGENTAPKKIRNAFVPIENRKAPGFPEVFDVLMGWCVRTGNGNILDQEDGENDDGGLGNESSLQSRYPHQRATLIHCGGGKGRAGIVLAAHLIRFGLLGHEGRGYCEECIRSGNIHPYDLEQFRKGSSNQDSVASTLPEICSSVPSDDSDEEEQEGCAEYIRTDNGVFRPVRRSECLNRYKAMMAAKDAMAHLRELRPGSIESVEQEKAVKAYGDWLWRRSSSKSSRSSRTIAQSTTRTAGAGSIPDDTDLRAKSKKKDHGSKQKTAPPPPPSAAQDDEDDFSDDDFGRGHRKSGKKGKKGSKKMLQEAPRTFVPPPADKIIKIPGSQHHQHHLVVQHNARARELQRGQKSKKNNSGGGGKQSKERPSYQVSGSPLVSAPKLVILVGLPGSGKSHLVTSLLQEYPEHFIRISQDELGSRSVCERLLAQSMRHQQTSAAARGPDKALPMTIFVDRCNPAISERKEWYEVAFQPDETIMVWFSKGVEQCIERVDSREGHPTVVPGMGSKVVRSFAKGFEFPNLSKEGSWCKTLIEVGDDEGSDYLLEIMKKFAMEVPASSSTRASNAEAAPVKARPAFIPTRVLQRKNNPAGALVASGDDGYDASLSHSKLPPSVSMASVEEEDEEDEGEGEGEGEGEEEQDEDEDENGSEDDGDDDDDGDDSETEAESTDEEEDAPTAEHSLKDTSPDPLPALIVPTLPPANMSITRALQFASPTGYRPAVRKPAKGSWKASADAAIDTKSSVSASSDEAAAGLAQEIASPRGVSFATPLSTYDRPLQKFPRTPHLFDPLTILQSLEQGTGRVAGDRSSAGAELSPLPSVGRSTAISRSDLLLPPSALHRVFSPKPHQVLTVEEKMDGANIGFSVLHFKTMDGFAGVSGAGPPPKIRVQNRNHFVHPDDHWQFKKLSGWLERHREDILWLCEGRWRYEARHKGDNGADGETDEKGGDDHQDALGEDGEDEEEIIVVTDDDGDEAWEDDDDDENEYVDEDKVLQDGLAPYVLYGEWMYAKHSVQYTGLRSWFVPFDLFDIKTGTFVSRALFRKAIAQTQLTPNPIIQVPEKASGDVGKTLEWTLEMLQSQSALMRGSSGVGTTTNCAADKPQQLKDRVEGLYFRIDQGDRLLMRSKVVRPDFIAGEERWGTKEQVANQLVFYEETLPDYDNEEDKD